MDVPAATVFSQHKSLRWAVPVLAVTVIGVLASGVLSAQASPDLPALNAAQVLAAVERSAVSGFSGEIVEKADLGLPELSSLGGDSGTSMVSLLSGSHTTRVWYAGPAKQRFALLSTVGEIDVFHDGTQLWQWDSNTRTATRSTLPDDASAAVISPDANPLGTAATSTLAGALIPNQVAAQALAAIDPSTVVTTDQARRVAGRAAYDLVLTPRAVTSRIGSVRIAIDSVYKMPLAVQVFARGDTTEAAIDIAFSSIDFAVPSNSEFDFSPPRTARVKQQGLTGLAAIAGHPTTSTSGRVGGRVGARVVGHGWTSVFVLPAAGSLGGSRSTFGHSGPPIAGATTTADSAGPSLPGNSQFMAMLGPLTPVSGTWGSGRLFQSKLLTVLITDDGQVLVGAVDAPVLYAAALASK